MTLFLLFPLSIFMGMPFLVGVKIVNRKTHRMIPWIWGVNGGTSVLGSILAVFIAINFGFNATLLVGVITYFIAMISLTSNDQKPRN